MCTSDLEKVAKVLNLAGFIEYIDDIGRRSVFSCEPENFPQIAISAQALNVDPQLVTEAVMRLAGGPVGSTEEIEYLAKELENES